MAVVDEPIRPATPLGSRRERIGWYAYDWANSAFITTVVTVFMGPYLTAVANTAAGCDPDAEDSCTRRIPVLFFEILPGQLFPYTISLSVFLVALGLPLVGAIADRTAHKRELLVGLAYTGSAATIGLLFLVDDRYLLGAGLFLVANVCFAASVVVYYSYLPYLAAPDDRDKVSSVGWAVGYAGGGLLLALNLAALLLHERLGLSEGDVVRYCLVSAGLWWAAFTTVPLLRLRNQPPLAGTASGFVVTDGFRQLWRTLKEMRSYPLTLLFLAAFLLYSDGIATVVGLSALYGSEELGLSSRVLVVTILVVQFVAVGGALLMGRLAARIGAWKAVLVCLLLWSLVVTTAYFLPAREVVPFLLLGGAIGIVLGGSQALSRSLFSHLIPAGREGEFYGVYEVSDRGTSWLGPLLFGLAYGLTESYRVAVVSVIVFFAAGFVLLLLVPMRRAILAAGNPPPRVL